MHKLGAGRDTDFWYSQQAFGELDMFNVVLGIIAQCALTLLLHVCGAIHALAVVHNHCHVLIIVLILKKHGGMNWKTNLCNKVSGEY